MIEIWFTQGTDRLRLPVLPETISVVHAGGAQRANLQAVGEIIMAGKRNLKTLQLESYFPARYDSNCQYRAIPLPSVAAALLQRWMDNGDQVRLMITGGPLDVNMLVLIEGGTFTMGKVPGDVSYQLTLTEYRPITVKRA
jgi:hypothetical protein